MKRKRFSEERIIGVLKEQEAGTKVVGLCRARSCPRGRGDRRSGSR